MKKTKIDWCDCTLNPVIGCKNGCEYCYARKINDRFHFVDNWDKPQFFPERLEQLYSKKPKSIFMDSMSDCGFWTVEQMRKIGGVIKDNPQHNYIFLTKIPNLFYEKSASITIKANKDNVFVGTTITKQNELFRIDWLPPKSICRTFISFEPLLEEIKLDNNEYLIVSQVIIGAETGNRKNKVIPKKEWVDNIVKFYDEYNIPIFMKESLREIMGKDFRQDKLIWEIEK